MPAFSRSAAANSTSSSARYLFDKSSESSAPRFGERGTVRQLARRFHVGRTTTAIGRRVHRVDRPARKGPVDERQRVATLDVACFDDAKIPTRTAGLQDELRHVESIPTPPELPARRTRLRDLHHRAADAIRVADRDIRFRVPFDGKILSEPARAAFLHAELLAPERIVIGRVHTDRLVRSAMDLQIGLAVAGQILRREMDSPVDGSLVDAARERLPTIDPRGTADVERHEAGSHGRLDFMRGVRKTVRLKPDP